MSLFQGLRKVISAVDKLRDFGLEEYIKLPRIVVVGSQSAGKSSLLEQIVGIDFLPRGSGVVTRRPLQLRLIYEPKQTLEKQYAYFKQVPDKKFFDFKEVKRTIEELTDKVCGKSKNIVDDPIILYVHSSNCPNLTLVDLPGITKVPIEGQPKNIFEITTNMCKKYIEDEKAIILCVMAANADLSTSDGLQLCRKIDVEGKRTLGCLTKIDLMDRGTNARDVLLNKQIQLRLGYVAIKNRSQEDINLNRTVAQSLQNEKIYFSTSQIYSTLPPGLTGTQALTQKLITLLYTQIKTFMPELIREINDRLQIQEQNLKRLGKGMPVGQADRQGYLWEMTSGFLAAFKGSIEGTYGDESSRECGPQIRRIMHELLEHEYGEAATINLEDQDIDRAIKYHNTGSIPGFPSFDAFLSLLVPLIKELSTPVTQTIHLIFQKLEETASDIARDKMGKLPNFRDDFMREVVNILEESKRNALRMANYIIDSEANYIFTSDIGYINCSSNPDIKELSSLARNNPLIYELRFRIDLYFKLVVRNLRDVIGKQIGLFMLNNFQKSLYFTLSQFIADRSNIDKWLNQPDDIRRERMAALKAVETLRNAEKFLRRDSGLADMFSVSNIKASVKQKQKNWFNDNVTAIKDSFSDLKDKFRNKKGLAVTPPPAPEPPKVTQPAQPTVTQPTPQTPTNPAPTQPVITQPNPLGTNPNHKANIFGPAPPTQGSTLPTGGRPSGVAPGTGRQPPLGSAGGFGTGIAGPGSGTGTGTGTGSGSVPTGTTPSQPTGTTQPPKRVLQNIFGKT